MKKITNIIIFSLVLCICISGCKSSNTQADSSDTSIESTTTLSETAETTSEVTNTNENNNYTYEQLKTWYDEASELMPDVKNGLTEMYIDEDKNVLIVGILDESYREIMKQELKDINDKDNWYEIIISEMPQPMNN